MAVRTHVEIIASEVAVHDLWDNFQAIRQRIEEFAGCSLGRFAAVVLRRDGDGGRDDLLCGWAGRTLFGNDSLLL